MIAVSTKQRLVRILAFTMALYGGSLRAESLRTANIAFKYDISATSFTYCAYTGRQGDPFGAPIAGHDKIKTVGSSATVTEYTASSGPFDVVSVGDILVVTNLATATPFQTAYRLITAKASSASITVDTAIDLSATGGYTWTYLKQSCGTTANDGWIPAGTDRTRLIEWQIDTINATSIEVQMQGRVAGANSNPVTLFPVTGATGTACQTGSTTGTITCVVGDIWGFSDIRFGVKVTGDAGAQSVTITYQGVKAGN